MKIWAKCLREQKIQKDVVQEFASARPSDFEGWSVVLDSLCKALDLSRPVMMNKHLRELQQFSRTVFYAADIMESVGFDRFEIEIFPEKKKKSG